MHGEGNDRERGVLLSAVLNYESRMITVHFKPRGLQEAKSGMVLAVCKGRRWREGFLSVEG